MAIHRKLTTICAAVVLSLGLAACGGGGDEPTTAVCPAGQEGTPPNCTPIQTPYDTAKAAIAAADTAAAAQAAYDAVKGDVTAAQGDALQMAVDARIAALAATARAGEQRTALMTAAGAIDTSGLTDAAAIAAANGAIAALKAAIAAAVDVDDTSMYQAQVTAAEAAVAAAQSALDHAAQTATLTSAVDGLQAIDLGNLSTQGAIAAAEGAIAAVRTALAAATELSDAEKAAAMAVLATANRTVMLAQGRLDIDGQKTVLSEAVDALDAIDLADLSTQAKIDAAQAAIIALDLALEAATDLTDAEKLDATVNVTVAKRAVASAQETLTANVGEQRTALMEAGTALGEIDLADLSTQDKIDAAQSAVNALKAALAAATHLSDAEKATYQSQLETATETVLTAQTGMDRDGRMVAQRTAINSAVSAAQTAVAGVNNDSTDSEVSAAEAAVKAVKDAIAAAADLSETDNAIAIAQGALKVLEPQLAAAKSKRQIAMDDKDKADRVAMAKLGKAMHAALAGPAADGTTVLNNITTHTLSSAGLAVDAAAGAGSLATDPGSVTLKAGDSTGSLGGWTGTNYAHTNNGTKVTNTAVVYTNQGAPKTEAFTTKYNVATTGDNKGYLTDTIDLSKVGGSVFVNSGTQVHTKAPREDAVYLDGTYDGASGEYKCVGDTCSVTNDGKGSPTSWSGTWTFKPNSGAQVSSPDAEYLYFGWWVSDDKDGVPTAASAFVGVVEPTANDLDRGNGGTTLTGGATYNGHAAGKFAMSNPLDGTGSAGHFTADATLTAKFGSNDSPNNGGISGTIDNFMANGESVPWSVSLHRATWGSNGAINASTADTTNTTGEGTTWSIDGNPAPESGTWSGQMYDEMPGNAPNGDGSNIPTTVTGTFYSEFSTIGRMVGAFGADKQ